MAASPIRVSLRRAQPGSPAVHGSVPGVYLRHRAAADEIYRSRRRALRWQRAILAIIACLFYFVIGRDLLAVARTKKDNAAMELREDTHQLATDVSHIAGAAKLASDGRIPGVDPAPARSGKGDADDRDSLLLK